MFRNCEKFATIFPVGKESDRNTHERRGKRCGGVSKGIGADEARRCFCLARVQTNGPNRIWAKTKKRTKRRKINNR